MSLLRDGASDEAALSALALEVDPGQALVLDPAVDHAGRRKEKGHVHACEPKHARENLPREVSLFLRQGPDERKRVRETNVIHEVDGEIGNGRDAALKGRRVLFSLSHLSVGQPLISRDQENRGARTVPAATAAQLPVVVVKRPAVVALK